MSTKKTLLLNPNTRLKTIALHRLFKMLIGAPKIIKFRGPLGPMGKCVTVLNIPFKCRFGPGQQYEARDEGIRKSKHPQGALDNYDFWEKER